VRGSPDVFLKCNLMTKLIAHNYQLLARARVIPK
jgi:hypothetical protein